MQNLRNYISINESDGRSINTLINCIIWAFLILLIISTQGSLAVMLGLWLLLNRLFSELDVRRLRSNGFSISDKQFPVVYRELRDICRKLGIRKIPTVVVLNASSMNAFAVRYSNRNVIVLLSQFLESVSDNTAELRFILGHELAHIIFDFGIRGHFELFRTPAYRGGREMTCDNLGVMISGDVHSAVSVMRKLCAGNQLSGLVDSNALQAESEELNSGITGWLLRRILSYPPMGKRISNAFMFAQRNADFSTGDTLPAASQIENR